MIVSSGLKKLGVSVVQWIATIGLQTTILIRFAREKDPLAPPPCPSYDWIIKRLGLPSLSVELGIYIKDPVLPLVGPIYIDE